MNTGPNKTNKSFSAASASPTLLPEDQLHAAAAATAACPTKDDEDAVAELMMSAAEDVVRQKLLGVAHGYEANGEDLDDDKYNRKLDDSGDDSDTGNAPCTIM